MLQIFVTKQLSKRLKLKYISLDSVGSIETTVVDIAVVGIGLQVMGWTEWYLSKLTTFN